MIKTLHLTNAYHASSGGIRTFYLAMIDAAARHERLLRLVVPGERNAVEDVNPYARVYSVAAPKSPFIDRRNRLILPHRFMLGTGALWSILREERPDLVEVCDRYSLCYLAGLLRIGWLSRTPRPALVGLTCERMDDNVATFLARPFVARHFSRWYMRNVYVPMFDAHIAVSAYAGAEVQPDQRPVHVLPMGLEVSAFAEALRDSTERNRLFGPRVARPGTMILLYVGRLAGEKNIPLLLDLIERLAKVTEREYHLCLAGEGPLGDWIRAEGDRRAIGRVHLLGHVADRRLLARIYANADVLVHPNPHEPFGLALLEAMTSGLPVIAPAAGGVLQYASVDNAWLVEPTSEAFAEAVLAMRHAPERVAAKVRLASATAERYDWSAVADRYFGSYDSIWEKSRPIRTLHRFWPVSVRQPF